jgi:hypothetical protein
MHIDDGARLWVNDQLLIDSWQDNSGDKTSTTIDLTSGQLYDIKVEYYEHSGSASVQLYWASHSQAKQIIPST